MMFYSQKTEKKQENRFFDCMEWLKELKIWKSTVCILIWQYRLQDIR